MKEFRFSLIAFLFLLLLGCQSEELGNQSILVGNHSLVASIEGQEYIDVSRTAVDDSGNVTWITTDELGVYGSVSENMKYSSTGNGSDVTFTGNLPETETAEWAYYPYDKDAFLDEDELTITLPDQYIYTGNSNAPMLGKSSGNNRFSFKHLGGLIRFTLGGRIPDNADRFVITSKGENQPISGQASFAIEGDNVAMSITSDGKQSISYDVSAIKDAKEFQHFFVPLPVGDYSKLEVSFYKKDSETPVFTRSLSNLTVKRAEMICMPILDWNTGKQFVLGNKTIIMSTELETKAQISSEKKTTLIVSNIAEENLPQLGEILLKGEVSKTFPEGFLGKVVSIIKGTDGGYVIETEPVPLDVAFKSLYIEKTIDLYPESISRSGIDIEQDIEGFYIFKKKIEYEGEDDGFNASLEMSLGLKLDVVINVEEKVMYFALRDKIGLTGELSVNKSFEEEKYIPLGPAIPLPTITVTSPIIITPFVQLYAVLKTSGEIEMRTELVYESRGRSWARYRSEAWEGDTDPRESEDSPWNARGSINMKGELFTGCSADFYGTFYGIQALAFGFEAEVGSRLFGDFNIETIQNENLDFVGINGGLNSQFELNSYFHIDANIFENELRAEFPLSKRTWGECFLYVLPTFTELQAKVDEEELRANISTEAMEKLLNKESQISLALIDSEGNIKEETEPIVYENPSINKTEQATPITTTFEKLEKKTEYQSYPIIQSPLLEDIVPDGKLELKYLSVSFKTKGSLREQLVQLYKNAGGENWTKNENWCSDKPIEEWYGIYESDGKYDIMLPDNNLIGTFSLSSPDISGVDISNNQIENLCLDGCSELEYLGYNNNPLVTLDLSECKVIDINFLNLNIETLRELRLRNCTQITWLSRIHSALETLDLSGCENIEYFPSSSDYWTGLSYLDISGCKLIENSDIINIISTVKYLNISGCEKITELSSAINLEELHAKGCIGLEGQFHICPSIRIVNFENCISLESIAHGVEGEYQLASLNVRGCTALEWIIAEHTKLESLDASGCTSLKDLYCQGNLLKTINLTGCTALEKLRISSGNYLQSLDVADCPNLKYLSCASKNSTMQTIDLSQNTELESLSCDVSSLDLSNNKKLKEFSCISGRMTESLDLSNLTLLENVQCHGSQIVTLNLSNCRNLKNLRCSNSSLTKLNLSGCTSLETLYCENNQLVTLKLDDCVKLMNLLCNNNNLANLNLSKNIELQEVDCSFNSITTFDLSKNKNLTSFYCVGNNNEVLDISNHALLKNLNFSGSKFKALNASGCTNLISLYGRSSDEGYTINIVGCNNIETINFNGSGVKELNLTGLSKLKELTCYNNDFLTSLNLTGCTSVSEIVCYNNPALTELTLMSSAPLSWVTFKDTRISHEIPDWFDLSSFQFNYEQRYTNYSNVGYDQENKKYIYTFDDKGYGWWFPGEPNSGRHAR